MSHVRPVIAAIIFGLAPPVLAAAVVLIADALGLFYGGPFMPAFTFAVASAFFLGSPAMALSGYTIAKTAATDRGASLVAVAFTIGLAATSLVTLVWSVTGWLSLDLLIAVGLTAMGGVAAVVLSVLVSFAARVTRPA